MTPAQRIVLFGSQLNVLGLPNNAAFYSLAGAESDSTYLTNGLGKLRLVADRSGNSATNVFASGGAASNTATTTTKSITGSLTLTADINPADYTPGTDHTLFSKLNGNSGIEWLLLTTGVSRLRIGDGSAITNFDSTVAIGGTDLVRGTLAVVYTDNTSMVTTFNGVAVGTTVTVNKTLADGSATATIGTSFNGKIHRIQIGAVYDFNPSVSTKLASSFVSGGDTWTVNSTGDQGARICGARDLYQGTTLKMPALSTGADGVNIATFDGSNDYLKSAAFSLSQPESNYFVGSQESWTDSDTIFDGNGLTSMLCNQSTGTPKVKIYAGSSAGDNADWVLNTRAVVVGIFNGASSSSTINNGTPVTGNCGASNGGGLTIGTGGTASSNFANMTFCAHVVRSVADDAATKRRITSSLIATYKVP